MFTLEPLPFRYDALEPYIDTETMHLHHDKHHQTYVDRLNELVKDNTKSLLELTQSPDQKIRNMAGGVYNHNLFWKFLNEAVSGKQLGVSEEIKDEFSKASLALFGSGWVWLTANKRVISTANQDAPKEEVLLSLDLWEHAYYLKYQNRRKDYIEAFWKLLHL